MSDNKENIPDLSKCKCPKCKFHRAPKLSVEEHAKKVLRIKKMLSWSSDDSSEDNLLPAGTTLKLTPDFRINLGENDPLSNFRTPQPVARAGGLKKFSLPNFRLNFDDVVDKVDDVGNVEGDEDDRKPAAVIAFNRPDNIHSMMSPIGSTIADHSVVTQPPNVNFPRAEVKIKIEPKDEPSPAASDTGFTLNVAVSMSATRPDNRKNKKRKTLTQQTITDAWRTTVAPMVQRTEQMVTNVAYDHHWIRPRVTSSGTFARVVPSSSPALQPMDAQDNRVSLTADDGKLAQILHQIELSEVHASNYPK